MGHEGSGDENRICPFPYGTAEHFAWTLREEFNAEVAGFVLWAINEDEDDRNIAFLLNSVYGKFGLAEAQYCAQYMYSFEYLPPMMPETRSRLFMNRLERELGLGGSGSDV